MEHVEVTRKGTPSRCCLENSREWCAHQGISSWRFGYIMNKTVKRLIKDILCLLQSVLEPNEMLRIRQASCSADKYRTMQIPESTDQFSAFLVAFDTTPNWLPLPDSIHNAAASHNFDPSMRINSTLLKGVPGRTSRPQTTNNQIGYAERTDMLTTLRKESQDWFLWGLRWWKTVPKQNSRFTVYVDVFPNSWKPSLPHRAWAFGNSCC